jgi:ABC-2 type transport system ATP-binding protein
VAAIEIEALTKRYGGRRGIDDVAFVVPEGALFGFIGPNGAGKTTTIRILLGLLRPDAGRARLFGVDAIAGGAAARRGVGYVAGETNLYPRMRVRDLLAYLGRFHAGDHTARRRELVDRLELDVDARARDLSLGNRKKVAVVAALQHRPRLVILDEATTGLDPVMQVRLHELLREVAASGVAVFFSSHVLAEVQSLCRTVAIIREGRLLAIEDVAALRQRATRRVRATFAGEPPALTLAGLEDARVSAGTLEFVYSGATVPLLEALARAAPTSIAIEEPSLDEIFMRHYSSEARHG